MMYDKFVKVNQKQIEILVSKGEKITQNKKVRRAVYCEYFDPETYLQYFSNYFGNYVCFIIQNEEDIPEYECLPVLIDKDTFKVKNFKWRNGERGIGYYYNDEYDIWQEQQYREYQKQR